MHERERRRPCIIISPVASGHLFEHRERDVRENAQQRERDVRENAHAVKLQTKLESKGQAIWGHKKLQLCQETVTQYRVVTRLVLVVNILFSI